MTPRSSASLGASASMRCRLTAAVLSLLFVIACATGRVRVNRDTSVDLSRYRTYSFTHDPSLRLSPETDRRIAEAVDAQLQSKGLRRVDNGGDLVATYHGSVDTPIDVSSYGYSYGQGWEWGGIYGPKPDPGSSRRLVTTVDPGTLVVDVVDANENELVWRGMAAGVLTSSGRESDKNVADVVAQMFSGFPARRV